MRLTDESWFATNEQDHAKLREFRHALAGADERMVCAAQAEKSFDRHGGA